MHLWSCDLLCVNSGHDGGGGGGWRRRCSVDGEHVALDLVAQLSLQVAQLLLEDRQRRHDDGLRSQRAARLHVIIEPERG